MNDQQKSIPFTPTANFIIHRKIFESVGGFNECFSAPGGEDNYMCIQLIRIGTPLKNLSKAVVYHNNDCSFLCFVRRFYNYGKGFQQFLNITRPMMKDYVVRQAIEKMGRGLKIYCLTLPDLLFKLPRMISEVRYQFQYHDIKLKNSTDWAILTLAFIAELSFQFGAVFESNKVKKNMRLKELRL